MTFVATSFRKVAALLCALCLAVFLLPVAAHAEENVLPDSEENVLSESEDDARVFTQRLEASAPVLRVGEPFDVNLVVTCDTMDEYPMYAYSCSFRVSADLFDLVDFSTPENPSLLNKFAITRYDDVEGNAHWYRFVLQGMGALAGTTWHNDTTVATVTLTPKALGNSTVSITRTNISNKTGMRRMPCTDVNLDLAVTGEAPLPARLVGKPLTAASGLRVAEFAGEVSEGSVPAFKGQPFAWDGQRFVMLMTANEFAFAQPGDFALVEGDAPVVTWGDVNENGLVNIIDAQISYDAACGVYTDRSVLSARAWLACDMNRDGVIEAADALAIQTQVLTTA